MKKTLLFVCMLSLAGYCHAQKKKGKDKKSPQNVIVDYQQPEAVADTATKFVGLIKYKMKTDDVSSNDSMFIIFGEDKIRVIMFNPGYKETDIFRDNWIANFTDSSFLVLDDRKKTYKKETLGGRNSGTEINLMNYRKSGKILNITCPEYSGDMVMKDGDTYQAAALISKQHSFINTPDYNFLNIQPIVLGYNIVLGWRTKSSDNENTYIIAYSIEKGNVDSWFDLKDYKAL